MYTLKACLKPCIQFAFVLLASLLAVAASFAGQESAAEELAHKLAALDAMQATFEQTVVDEGSDEGRNDANDDGEGDEESRVLDRASGWMAWQQPDKFRWEVEMPMQQSILIDAKRYFQYDKDLDQMLVQPLSEEIALLPKLLLSGSAKAIAESFDVKRSIETVDTNVFILRPLENSALFSKVILEFHEGQLSLMTITDELGQTNTFSFVANSDISDNNQPLFHLEPAPGTEVIY